jgi:UDP-GlcNAc3NAcA epimerase
MKIVTIVGARPQFVKAALVSQELKMQGIEELIVHTGQHYDANMSAIFFDQMGIKAPAYNLNIQAKLHGAMTGQMLIETEKVLMHEQPDWVMVYGDTNSTLAGALAARKLNIKIAHVEAGLRNHNFNIPEDVNRVITDRISDLLFCPTTIAIENLRQEGFLNFPIQIVKTDDLMSDTVRFFSKRIEEQPTLVSDAIRSIRQPFILCTVHRQASTTPENLPKIIDALNEIAQEIEIVFPIHPRTLSVMQLHQIQVSKRIHLTDPVGYLDMQYLLKNANYVVTDSGGLQKEAYLHGVYSLILEDYTPWEELITHQVGLTTSLETEALLLNYHSMKQLKGRFDQYLFGHGHARKQIVETFLAQKGH